jgi:hypothetical protein
MTVKDDEFAGLVETALDNLRAPPKNLADVIDFVARTNDREVERPLARLVEHLERHGPNDRIRHALTLKLQHWDHEDHPGWSRATEPHSSARRADALRLLGFPAAAFEALNEAIPVFTEAEIPIVIAEGHERWYEDRKPLIRSFYWDHYKRHLAKPKGTWSPESIAALDASTDDVLARLSDPMRATIYQVKGLVMGYVQSGKTSHFTGLIAKAADAGYRLIIVFAGTMDILREQTQRRIDKEIVGRELLGPDEYGLDADWSSFVEHGGRPSDMGHFDWTRLTDRGNDYSRIEQHLTVLEFRPANPGKPFNAPDNLRSAPARLAVIKKTPARIGKLCDDLERLRPLRNALEHVPTVIIDDESDQASVNTVDQAKPGQRGKRTSTNKAIGRLLKLLPRAQYVGYTATPFANVFIDPNDADDLFPKDYIVSLPRPEGYMGVSDFYDFDAEYDEGDVRSNRAAFVRSVEGANEAATNLPRAIDAFVLSGAIKLFRQHAEPTKYQFGHHTMLVHHSAQRAVHKDDAEDVRKIFGGGSRYQKREGLERLEELFAHDFVPISRVHAPGAPFPKTFDALKLFITDCVTRICDEKPVLIVNGDNKDDTPDFDQKPVWAILVGGAKLSRGYTVEGLTTSYFRRPAGAGDTLMQMGRWFGFRPGYRDLVRLYIGKKEQRGKRIIDLYEAFGAVCRDEEALRRELLRYGKVGLTPKQVPPLVHQHLPQLPPASKNKMFNAQIRSLDFAGDWTEKTSAPVKPSEMSENLVATTRLLGSCRYLGRHPVKLTNSEGVRRSFDADGGLVAGDAVLTFLNAYRWSEGKEPVRLEIDYVREQLKTAAIGEWMILAPQVGGARTFQVTGSPFPKLAVVIRSRVSDSRFGVYSEPRHRDAAQFLAGISNATGTSEFLKKHRNPKRPVLVLYLVDDVEKTEGDPSIGFGIQFPGEKKSDAITWSVVDPRAEDEVVVPKVP